MSRALIATSVDWVNLTRLPRTLKNAGLNVTVIAPPNSVVFSSRFVDIAHAVDGNAAQIAQFVANAVHNAAEEYEFVIIGDDALFKSLGRDEALNVDSWFPMQRDESLLDFMLFKIAFHEICRDVQLGIAPFEVCESLAEAEKAASAFGYPLICKNITSVGGQGIHKVGSLDALGRLIATFSGEFIIQQFIQGRPFSTEVLYNHGEPIRWVSSEQHNRGPRELGTISARRIIQVPSVLPALQKLGSFTKFHGIAVVDAILPNDGSAPVLCEMNPMPGPDALVDSQVSREFSAGIRYMLRGGPAPTEWVAPEEKHITALFPESVYYALGKPTDMIRWCYVVNSLRRLPLDDPKLLAHFCLNIAFEIRNMLSTSLLSRSAGRLRKNLYKRAAKMSRIA